ncbi:hypothetical protein Q3G72_018313 [Acer saccharum]|nr:hypothetical protein Q3G72_018313 [Acer saccharum]
MAPSLDEGNSLFNFVVQDGYGVKGMVDLGLTTVPEAYVQPPKERIDKLNSRPCSLSPIDLSKLDGPEHDRVAEEIARAASTLGVQRSVTGVLENISGDGEKTDGSLDGKPRSKTRPSENRCPNRVKDGEHELLPDLP